MCWAGTMTLLLVAGCGAQSGSLEPGAEPSVPVTARALVAIALEHVSAEPSNYGPESGGGEGMVAADIRFRADGEYDGDSFAVGVTDQPVEDVCQEMHCRTVETRAGPATVGWVTETPEEDPGYVSVLLERDGEQRFVGYSGETIDGDPADLDLRIGLDEMLAVVTDPRFASMTTPDAVEAGADLPGWPTDLVPATPQAVAVALLSHLGGTPERVTPAAWPELGTDGVVGVDLRWGEAGATSLQAFVLAQPTRPTARATRRRTPA